MGSILEKPEIGSKRSRSFVTRQSLRMAGTSGNTGKAKVVLYPPIMDENNVFLEKEFAKVVQKHIRACIAKLPRIDVWVLEDELGKWIEKDPRNSGDDARKYYGLPQCAYTPSVPEDTTEVHEYALAHGINLDEFDDSGRLICAQIYRMIVVGLKKGRVYYFTQFHHLVCQESCKDYASCPVCQ